MMAQNPVLQDGVSYDLTLSFRPATALDEIMLSSTKVTSWENCQTIFLGVLGHAESGYGAFVPLVPAQRTAESGVSSSIEWHDVAGRASRYQVSHTVINELSTYGFNAKRSEGGKALEVSADWSAKQKGQTEAECFTKLVYDKSP
jgi:hypothetical protein